MRILWLKSDLLLPLDKGGKLRTWHLMRHLARHHEITYLAFAAPDQLTAHPCGNSLDQQATNHAGADLHAEEGRRLREIEQPVLSAVEGPVPSAVEGPVLSAVEGPVLSAVEGMQQVAARVETIPRVDPPKGSWRFYADAAVHLVDPLPYAVGKYRSRAYRRKVNELLAAQSFDLIVCDFLVPAVNLPRRLPCPAVIFTHNVESEIWRRHAATSTSLFKGLLYRHQYRRMLRFERRTLKRFDGVLAVSNADRDGFDRIYPGAVREPARVVPTGVDTEFFAPTPSPAASRRLVFTGSMDWLPNQDAMVFFCREILRLIRAEEPDVTLSIVGRAPTPTVLKLAEEPGVQVTGRVEDVRPYMADAAVYVVPLRIGGGTRLKIFEAMAMGKAVVSTTVGAEGLPVTNGEHVLLADEQRAFARDVVSLLRDIERRRQLEAAARALVVKHYDWSAVAGELEDALVRFAQLRPREAALSGSLLQTTAASD